MSENKPPGHKIVAAGGLYFLCSAMRLMRIGQHEAHGLLADALARVPTVVDALIARRAAPAAFTPTLDAVMSQQYVRSRLFLS